MTKHILFGSTVILCCAALLAVDGPSAETEGVSPAPGPTEARARAQMLYEMVRGTLQIMHRDFFDEDNAHAIPSASLEDVFHEMDKNYDVRMKWLVVNTDLVNVEHEADTDFEKAAVKTLAAGQPFAEDATSSRYQFAGAIPLRSQCLKCHVKQRTSTEDRVAGLVITMPLKPAASQEP